MTKKPEIIIASGDDDQRIQALLYGIEEEEIPFKVTTVAVEEPIARAYESAIESQLSVGIAYDQSFAYLHFKNLPPETPLFKVSLDDQDQLNRLGANAARLVKGVPFKEIE
ncbi:glycerol dehydratase reactivase beta/small subunit family protein [Latilactobacillus fuchuensis]|jgi:hypothetical protein|uniref:Propanediol utilization protein PduH n=2 Tax=Latilactobacillus fuchuensis TaxID=164393 RepID=A0A2N9DY21_9LACO|nr:glycerol dehydratase reactivase beta/small subunit family protein [Latilactobacillus fuchuensis]KRL58572.1 hypothetical protein FC69_GL000224 [Latilactobacillus fuchuensis DSM 14340 = JCM 11249]MCP8857419.1 glycerol dehydratase reactivase beta/small subunit family protein [Latilactobacillus fuchuensis]SPC39779.1 Propanediol utilization protein PduH [Latilactobacillus fuchuensis]